VTSDGPLDSGGLEVVLVEGMGEEEPGGTAVVLLHGWGAPGDDLVALADLLVRPQTRFFVPAAPLSEFGEGRAWWHLDPSDRPAHAWDDKGPAGYQPCHLVMSARAAVRTLLGSIRSRYAPDALIIGGFSQGAMLSLDVALAEGAAVDRVAALSGVLLADSLASLHTARSSRPPVFLAHGRHDTVVPFAGAERANEILTQHGFAVTWRPFDGGHEIPPSVVKDLRSFFASSAESMGEPWRLG